MTYKGYKYTLISYLSTHSIFSSNIDLHSRILKGGSFIINLSQRAWCVHHQDDT